MSEVEAMTGLAATRARITQLQSMIASVSGAGAVAPGRTAGGRLGVAFADATGFDDVLGQVDGSTGLDTLTSGSALPLGATAAAGLTTSGLTTSGMNGTRATGASGAALGEKAVGIARRYLGIPYQWGGTDPDKGLDCSGLTQLVFRQVGVDLPRVSRDQARQGREVASVSEARPGDLVFFDSPVDHVGIYVGENKILHAPHTGDKVKISTIWEKPSHIRRVLPETSASALSLGRTTATQATSGATATGASDLTGPYADLFERAGRRYGVDPALLSAVAKAESGYRPGAVSRAGARGLMQIMPATARGLGVDPDVPAQAVDGAARLLSGYLKQYDGRTDLALAAYNAGPGAVRRYGGVPPYSETRTYIQRVTGYWKDLR